MTRRRHAPAATIVAVLVALALTLPLAVRRTPARADLSTLTRLRISVQSSSDWAAVDLVGMRIRAAHVASAPSPTTVTTSTSTITVRGLPAASAVVDAVVEVPADITSPVIRVRKGLIGTATAVITRTIDTDVDVATITNRESNRYSNVVEVTVTRDALVGSGLVVPKVDDRKLVLAFYYPWFTENRFSRGVWFDRPVGPYSSDDPAAVASMVNEAATSGINGFLVEADGLDHVAHFDLVLGAAAGQPGFSVAPYLDIAAFTSQGLLGPSVNMAALIATGQEVVRRAGDPSYLHVGSRPVLAVFGMWQMQADAWAQVRRALESVAGPLFVVGDRNDPGYALDGFHYYNPNARDADELTQVNASAADALRLRSLVDPAKPLQLWAATVSPGENNLASDPLHPVYRSRDGGTRYDETWRAALSSDPDWVLVTSWNEWFELTNVQPGTASGTTALSQTRSWAARWHT